MPTQFVATFFRKAPVLANVATGFVVFSAGDLGSQMLVDKRKWSEVDVNRVATTGAFGMGLNGVFLTYYYRWMDRIFSSRVDTKTIIRKMVADEVVGAPICCGAFFAYAAAQQGGTLTDILERFKTICREKFVATWITDACVWPAANFVNFKWVPLHFRPAWIGVCQICWNAFLSSVSFEKEVGTEPEGGKRGDEMVTMESTQAQAPTPALSPAVEPVLDKESILRKIAQCELEHVGK